MMRFSRHSTNRSTMQNGIPVVFIASNKDDCKVDL